MWLSFYGLKKPPFHVSYFAKRSTNNNNNYHVILFLGAKIFDERLIGRVAKWYEVVKAGY